jgi:hypothetical protein
MSIYELLGMTFGCLIIIAGDFNAISDVAVAADDVGVIADWMGYVGALSPGDRSHSLMRAAVSA